MENKKLIEIIIGLLGENTEGTDKSKSIQELATDNIGKYVILRGHYSGVFFGKLDYASTGLYKLSEARQLWYWYAKKGIGLTSVAEYGIKDNESKICGELKKIEITDPNVCEIIPCSKEAIKNIQNAREYNV